MADTRRLAEQYMLRTRMTEYGGAVGRPWITDEVVAFAEERIAAARREAFEEAAQLIEQTVSFYDDGEDHHSGAYLADRIRALAEAKKGGG